MNRRELLAGASASLLLGMRASAQYQPQGKALVQRLTGLQTASGAILMPGSGADRTCNPYFANWGVYGALVGAPPRSRTTVNELAKRWILWYTSHLNKNGTIDDHRGPENALKATGKYDSSDSYAATFLAVCFAYHEQTGDAPTLFGAWDQIVKVAEACLLTQQRSALTYARPGYDVVYMMDNAEVWYGLNHFSRLCKNMRKKAEMKSYTNQVERVYDAIEQWMWSPTDGCYSWALHPNGKRDSGLDKWYPGQMANLLAISLLPIEDRRTSLLKRMGAIVTLPEKITKTDQLERLIFWSLASLPTAYQDNLEDLQVRLSKAPWDDLNDVHPGLLGHALRIGKGQFAPQEIL